MPPNCPGLLQPIHLWSRSEVLAKPCPVPASAGVYAWFFRQPPPGVPVDGCHRWLDHTLLYVGISPSEPPSNGKPPRRQSLRLTLGCLLGLTLRRVGSGHRMTFAENEAALSQWMAENAFVAWAVHSAPWRLERELIAELTLPLNLDQNERCAFHGALTELRQKARGMAVVAARVGPSSC